MAEYVRFRMRAAKAGVTMALLALLGGLAERSRAATPVNAHQASSSGFLKLTGITHAITSNFLKIEAKLVKLDSSISNLERSLPKSYLKIRTANNTFLKLSDANAKFLKLTDANAKFLKIDDANATFLKLSDAANFFQGKGNVVSGALSSLTGQGQQLLSLPGGIIVVTIANTPGAGSVITIHNSTSEALGVAVDMGAAGGVPPTSLKPNGDTNLPAVQNGGATEIRLQIFPGTTFTNVVSILIGLTPNPATQQPEAVAQAFTGGI